MSGNSADSFSEDSDAEEHKEEVKEKAEVVVKKKKGPGRPPRKKKPPAATPLPVTPPAPNAHKRRCGPPKSGKCRPYKVYILLLDVRCSVTDAPTASCREARCAEAAVVRG